MAKKPGAKRPGGARVWITGASEGIGRATAIAFAGQGARLAICARRSPPLLETATTLRDAGAQEVVALTADVGVRADVERFAREALTELGGCDVLVNNAGGGGPGGLFDLDDDAFESDWRYAFEVNLMAPARLARAARGALIRARGVVINVSSAWSRQPMPITPPSYGCTKSGLNHLTLGLARELGPKGVRVVGVAPGPVWTESWERDLVRTAHRTRTDVDRLRREVSAETGSDTCLGRPGRPEEVAAAIVWLAAPEASFITGTTLAVDGGYLRAVP